MEKKRPIIIGAVVAILVLALVVWFTTRPRDEGADVAPAVTTSAPAPTTDASGSASAAAPASTRPACSTASGPIADPKKFIIERTGVDERMMKVGTESDGAVGAPPKDEPRTAAWWQEGPLLGSDAGHAIVSIHTYHQGGALGNEMYEGDKKLQVGDVVKVAGEDGSYVCYELTDIKKIAVADYTKDPNAFDLFDVAGPPKLVVIICWDYDKATKDWDSRVLFYGDKF